MRICLDVALSEGEEEDLSFVSSENALFARSNVLIDVNLDDVIVIPS